MDIFPDFSIFQVWVELDNFHLLFFGGAELVEVIANSVETSKDGLSEVVAASNILHQFIKIAFRELFLGALKLAGGS